MPSFNELTGLCLRLTVDDSKPFKSLEQMFHSATDNMTREELLTLRNYLDSLLSSNPSEALLMRLWHEPGCQLKVRTGSPGAWRQFFATMKEVVSETADQAQ